MHGAPSRTSAFAQLTDVEGERNALLTYDRVPKVDFEKIRAVNEEFLHG
jgi:hypothetical protein